jgi:hypothetical protein
MQFVIPEALDMIISGFVFGVLAGNRFAADIAYQACFLEMLFQAGGVKFLVSQNLPLVSQQFSAPGTDQSRLFFVAVRMIKISSFVLVGAGNGFAASAADKAGRMESIFTGFDVSSQDGFVALIADVAVFLCRTVGVVRSVLGGYTDEGKYEYQ